MAMRTCLSEDLQCDVEQINVKATTTEKLGYTGRKEGVAVHCVVLLTAKTQLTPPMKTVQRI
jgi:2-C-methyl-D-erythritol 2,4-cyclodiphosphate synthase